MNSIPIPGTTDAAVVVDAPPPPKRKKITRKKLFGKGAVPLSSSESPSQTPAPTVEAAAEDDFFNLSTSYEKEEEERREKEKILEEAQRVKQEKQKLEEEEKKAAYPVVDLVDSDYDEDDSFLASPPKEIPVKPEPTKHKRLEEVSQASTPAHVAHVSDLEADEEIVVLDDTDREGRHAKRARVRGDDDEYINEIEAVASVPQEEEKKEEEPQEEMDPVLLEKIRRRKAELAALENLTFTVGVIIRTLIVGFETMPPFVTTQASTVRMGEIRQNFLKGLWENNPGVDPRTQEVYNKQCILVWNNTRVFDFATPVTLGVSQKSPSMLLNAMTIEDFEKNLEEEFQRKLAVPEEVDYDELVRRQLDELANAGESSTSADASASAEDGYFRVAMKGKDNQQVEVSVNQHTTISKLAEYYRTHHGIAEDKKLTLMFDDEELDMDATVGDTELEEDFTIDVYIS